MNIYDELVYRGLIQDQTNNDLKEKLNKGGMTFYIGTDPTGDSLHIGHLSSFLICKRLKDAGHNPVVLVGGATGLIGDPKPDAERPMITYEEVEHNYKCLTEQLTKLFDCEVVNNYDWIKNINTIDFLRDYGKYFSVNYMLAKDIVSRRMESGITFTEFSYMILQALDFLYLYENKGITMQVCGADQWGNVTAGIELIRKKLGKEAYAFTMPLVTKKDGTKFGKTNGKAIWLDREKTSPYEMYQFFINVEDEMVETYLKRFTFLSKSEIEAIMKESNESKELRIAHKRLAYEVVKFVHSEKDAIEAQETSEKVFSGTDYSLIPSIKIDSSILNNGISGIDLLIITNLCSSKSEARRLIEQNGISINSSKIDLDKIINKDDLKDGSIVIQKGKKVFLKVEI